MAEETGRRLGSRADRVMRLVAAGILVAAIGLGGLVMMMAPREQVARPRELGPSTPMNFDMPAPETPAFAPPPERKTGRLAFADAAPVDLGTLDARSNVQRSVILRNVGDGPVEIERIAAAGPLDLRHACEGRLDPGQECVVMVRPRGAPGDGRFEAEVLAAGSGRTARKVFRGHWIEPPPPPPRADPALQRLLAARQQARPVRTGGAPVQDAGEQAPRRRPGRHYEEAGFPTVKAAPPVDRSRLWTPDRCATAVLDTGVQGHVGGEVRAQVDAPLYAPQGRRVLLEAGTMFLGEAAPQSDLGVLRLPIVWHEILTPAGARVRIDWPAADRMGRPGVPGTLDQRLAQRYGAWVFQTSVALALAEFVGDSARSTRVTDDAFQWTTRTRDEARMEAVSAAAESLAKLTQQVLREKFPDRPVLQVAAGTQVVICPKQDIYLPRPGEDVVLRAAAAATDAPAERRDAAGGDAATDAGQAQQQGEQSATAAPERGVATPRGAGSGAPPPPVPADVPLDPATGLPLDWEAPEGPPPFEPPPVLAR